MLYGVRNAFVLLKSVLLNNCHTRNTDVKYIEYQLFHFCIGIYVNKCIYIYMLYKHIWRKKGIGDKNQKRKHLA